MHNGSRALCTRGTNLLLERLWTPVTEKSDFADVLRLLFLINDCFGEYLTAINGDLYGENVGALPGDFIILLCLCHGDLNGEQPFMGRSVSYLLNGETITAFLFRLCKLSLLFFLTIFKHLKRSLNIPFTHIALLDFIKHQQTVQDQIRYCFIILWH